MHLCLGPEPEVGVLPSYISYIFLLFFIVRLLFHPYVTTLSARFVGLAVLVR